MNESLAIRKFKQNIHDREIRIMALTTEHTSLAEAIAHATEKKEQFQSSNLSKEESKPDSIENKSEKKSNGNGNGNKNGNKKRAKRIALSAYKPFFRSMLFQKQNPFGAQKRE